jgi:hypothetical protein
MWFLKRRKYTDEEIKGILNNVEKSLPQGLTMDDLGRNLILIYLAKRGYKVTLMDGRTGTFVKSIKGYKFMAKIDGKKSVINATEIKTIG